MGGNDEGPCLTAFCGNPLDGVDNNLIIDAFNLLDLVSPGLTIKDDFVAGLECLKLLSGQGYPPFDLRLANEPDAPRTWRNRGRFRESTRPWGCRIQLSTAPVRFVDRRTCSFTSFLAPCLFAVLTCPFGWYARKFLVLLNRQNCPSAAQGFTVVLEAVLPFSTHWPNPLHSSPPFRKMPHTLATSFRDRW